MFGKNAPSSQQGATSKPACIVNTRWKPRSHVTTIPLFVQQHEVFKQNHIFHHESCCFQHFLSSKSLTKKKFQEYSGKWFSLHI